jgi:hypothetical protein
MSEPCLLIVRPGSLTKADKLLARKIGIVTIEHDNPAELRLLRPSAEVDGSDMLRCAMKALASVNGTSASTQRENFTRLIAAALDAQERKP